MISQDSFSFEETPWERFTQYLQPGQQLSAVNFLTLLEGQDEDLVDDAFLTLEQLGVKLDISDLPKDYSAAGQAARLRLEEKMENPESALEQLEENDPLRLYLEELAHTPVSADPSALARLLADLDPDCEQAQSLRSQLVELSLSRVVQLALEFTGHGVLLLDLIQEGSLGLYSGIFAVGQADFETVRDWHIRQAMAKAVVLQAREAGVGAKVRQAMEDYRSVDERLLTELGRNPTPEEIAQGMNVSAEEAARIGQMLENTRAMYRTKKPEPEALPQEDDQAVEDTAYFQMRQRISELLRTLSEADARLLTLRYGLEGGLPMSAEQVAREMGIGQQEVTDREAAALAKLRAQ